MVFVNEAHKAKQIPREYAEGFVKLLAPIAPHMMEEIWQKMGHNESITYAQWPIYDESKLADKEVKIAVQVNGKLRGQFIAAVDASKDDLQDAALKVENVKKYTDGKNIVKIIVVPNKIVNIVVK